MILAWYDPTNHHVSTDKHDPLFTPLGQLWPLHRIHKEESKWIETNNHVCDLLKQAHDVLALTSLPMKPRPLTKEAVGLLIGNSLEAQSWLMSVVRAVEKAHGIGEKDE